MYRLYRTVLWEEGWSAEGKYLLKVYLKRRANCSDALGIDPELTLAPTISA